MQDPTKQQHTDDQNDSKDQENKQKMSRSKLALLAGGGVAALIIIIVIAVIALIPAAPQAEYAPTTLKPITVEDTSVEVPEPASPVFPLTGVQTDDEAATQNRTLSVKIENTPDARPQTGLSSADVVYETVAEGGITRFNCLFQSQVPQEVGPVRSARLSDLSIVPQYDALFFFSGANPYVVDQIAAAGLPNMSHGAASSLYYRVDYRVMPHNLYLNLSSAHTLAPELGFAATVDSPHSLKFSDGETLEGRDGFPSATEITVPLSDFYIANWAWDASSGRYLRSMDGPTIDAATGEQVGATNVVVLWTNYTISPDGLTFLIDLNGTGAAALFIDGKRIDGSWESDGSTPPRFKDAAGNPILLKPGTTWFEVIDQNTTIS
jgi:hypothetical protein